MDQVYDIMYDSRKIGKAIIRQVGLYFEITCDCKLPDAKIYRIVVHSDNETICLGVYIPSHSASGLVKKISCKHLKNMSGMQFQAVTDASTEKIKIEKGKPLPVLERLGSLVFRNNMLCVANNANLP